MDVNQFNSIETTQDLKNQNYQIDTMESQQSSGEDEVGRAPGPVATSSATIEFVEEKRKSEKERRKSEKEK